MKPVLKQSVYLGLACLALSSLPLTNQTASSAGKPAAAPSKAVQEGAKDLFYKQLEKPQLAMNTGLQYWIELHRKGQKLKVSNKTVFYSGDKIRFHIRPNIDGYAYVLLKCGSKGNRDVLFPQQRFNDDNRIVHGKEVAIPTQENDLLEFDNDPGIEQVGIVLSRHQINAEQYLNKVQPVVIASGIEGSKDLVPSRVVVQPAATQEAPSTSSQIITVSAPGVSSTTTSPPLVSSENQPDKPSTATTTSATAAINKQEPGVTTVVQQDAAILCVDVMMQHK